MRTSRVTNASAARRPDLAAWRHVFATLDRCPWPGPRPLTSDDDRSYALHGRDDDRRQFRQEVDTRKLVILAGLSGVGKSSLLWRGLVPDLEDAGYRIAKCRDWSGAAETTNSAAFLAPLIQRDLGEPDLPSDTSFFRAYAEKYGERAVIVLDQFEELIRDSRPFADDLFRRLAEINRFSPIKLIISLREENLFELRPLERQTEPWTTSHYFLEPVDDRHLPEIVAAGNEVVAGSIADDAVPLVVRAWEQARGASDPGTAAQIGLLHLQALLYVLHDAAAGDAITSPHAERFLGEEPDGEPSGGTGDVVRRRFEAALAQAVNVKLARCERAAVEVGVNPYLIHGTRDHLARAVGHLSSAGYKLVRDARDLVENALGHELATLQRAEGYRTRKRADGSDDVVPSDVWSEAQFDALLGVSLRPLWVLDAASEKTECDLLTASRRDLAAAADRPVPRQEHGWLPRLQEGTPPEVADPAGVSCGPMQGCAPAATLVEELRRYTFALEWLRASSLVRLSTPGAGQVMVALIHDGFGAALKAWSAAQAAQPRAALHAITARPASEFVWVTPPGEFLPELDGATEMPPGVSAGAVSGARVLVNLNWSGAFVRARFRKVVFVNCDFRGASFDECEFAGVSFVNCLLDGLLVSDCHTTGPRSEPSHEGGEPPPFVYRIVGSEAAAQHIAEYRDQDSSDAGVVQANLPGLVAATAHGADVAGRPVRNLGAEPGSVVIHGGRLSTMAVRSCTFDADSWFCLRDTTGSGFAVTEHSERGRYEIVGSALRHLTFTSSPVTATGGDEIDVRIEDSVVVQAWLGHDLSGHLAIEDSRIYQIWNSSPKMTATAKTSSHFGLMGVHCGEGCEEITGQQADLGGSGESDRVDGLPPELTARDAARMDYRRMASHEEYGSFTDPGPGLGAAGDRRDDGAGR